MFILKCYVRHQKIINRPTLAEEGLVAHHRVVSSRNGHGHSVPPLLRTPVVGDDSPAATPEVILRPDWAPQLSPCGCPYTQRHIHSH